MKPRRAQPQTADLFAAAAPSHAPAPQPQRRAGVAAPSGGVPPTPRPLPQPRPRQLWYAAVFPELQAPAAAAALQRLSLHAGQFTPLVSIEPPNALLLEIKGSLRLFGPPAGLHALIDARWRELGMAAQSAVAPATLAALWCARAGARALIEDPALLPGALARLPLACTAWDEDRLHTLRALGITRLGELLRLPRAGLARRFGPATVLDLDIALARQREPRRAFVARERFRERCDFETEIEHADRLERALEPVIERCARFLRGRQAGVQTLELRLRHRSAPASRLRLGLAGVTSERRRLWDVLAARLMRFELPAPVRSAELVSGHLQPLDAVSLSVFTAAAGAGGRATALQLVERLRARLGEQAVYGLSAIPEHRPEAAWRRVHELRLAAASAVATEGPQGVPPRPVWLLDAPMPLRSPQTTLEWQVGPERIESGWWDGKGVARDYYVVREPCGARLWVFQERRTRLWYLHGVFA